MSKKTRKYDFAGWVTKNDIRCADGVTIKHDAFKNNHGKKVPLVWNHDYNNPSNVLGFVELDHNTTGVYGYGYFNDTGEANNAKELVKHGDISSMSIGARKIKRSGNDVVHGDIYEVSLVLAGANPGAMIDTVIAHSENGDSESGIIYTGTLIHSIDDIIDETGEEDIKHKEEEEKTVKSIGDVVDTMNEEQKEALYALLGSVVESYKEEEEEETVKQNVFNKEEEKDGGVLKHSVSDILQNAIKSGASSLKQSLEVGLQGEELKHGINSIEMLFPEAMHNPNGNTPVIYKDPNTSFEHILSKVTKSPFSRVKTLFADLTEDEARAKGYIKGNMKKEEFFSLIKRTTTPQTVYKKQKLDRDDIIDITDFNVVAFMNQEMRMMLKEELARAILVGDGRDYGDDDKINEHNVRPIITDHEFFTRQFTYTTAVDLMEKIVTGMRYYRGSGSPELYIDPEILAEIKLLKGSDNRYLFGDIPSTEAVAARLGVSAIIPSTFMVGKGALVVNLRDYTLGANKGGEITTFDDFDIDFNQYKYLIETRISGALTMPSSALHFHTTVVEGDTDGGVVYGTRQPAGGEG